MSAQQPTGPVSAAPARRRRWVPIALGVLAIVVVAILILALVPVPQSTSSSWGDNLTGEGSVWQESYGETFCPAGASAKLSYQSSGVSSASSLTGPDNRTLYASTDPNWTTNFTVASCAVYWTNVSGTGQGSFQFSLTLKFSAPLL